MKISNEPSVVTQAEKEEIYLQFKTNKNRSIVSTRFEAELDHAKGILKEKQTNGINTNSG
jgi:hypothetical protein